MKTVVPVSVSDARFPPLQFVLQSPLRAGALVRVCANGPSMLSSVVVHAVVAARAPDQPFEMVHHYTREAMEKDWNWYISTRSMAIVRVPRELAEGELLVVESGYRAGHEGGSATPVGEVARFSGLVWRMELASVPEETALEGVTIAEPFGLALMAGPAARGEAWLKPDGTVRAGCFDAHGNPTGPAVIVAVDSGPVDSAGRVRVKTPAGPAVTNAWPAGLDGTPVWFGEFHWHTDFSSDGQRAMADALASARDELGLDFAGPGDHLWASGSYGRKGPREQAETCRRFDEPGRFCTLAGAELSRRYGHANLYAIDFDTFAGIVDRFPQELKPEWDRRPDQYGLEALTRLCIPGKSLVIPHHSNMDSFVRERVVHPDGRPYWCALHFPIPADRAIVRLFEMVQGRGAFESEETDDAWRIYDGGLGGSARTALMRGYRMGFVGGTDNHCGWPTRGHGGQYIGVTAVQAPALDTASVFQALYARRCYATSGARIIADMTLNGHPMGSELVQEPGARRLFRISVRGTAPLTHVQLIHFGYVLKDFALKAGSLDLDAEWDDDRPGRPLEDAWYYLRIRQEDGHCAWLSPVWVDLPGECAAQDGRKGSMP